MADRKLSHRHSKIKATNWFELGWLLPNGIMPDYLFSANLVTPNTKTR